MTEFLTAVVGGMLFVIGIIAGIGPQNLNIMSHAIRRNHELAVATTCFLADSVLILIGCIGLELTGAKWFINLINIVGILFMIYYLWSKINNLNKPHNLRFDSHILSLKPAVIRALALTWLNPLVFIDTIVVIGGTSTHYQGWHHLAFTIGALVGDFCWLFGVTLLARTFANKLNQPRVWLILDIATIVIIAYILTRMLSFFLL